MFRSLFSTRFTIPVKVGEEAAQIKINFLLPIIFCTILYSIFSLTVSIIAKEYGQMIVYISSVVLLLLSFDFLRNGSLRTAVVLFLVQGIGMLTANLLLGGIDLIPQVLMVIFYLIVAGLVTNPKVFILLVIYSTVVVFLMVSEALAPLFPVHNLPGWFSFSGSLILMAVLVVLTIFLAYRALVQSIQIAENANKKMDLVEQDKNKYFSMIEKSPLSIFTTDLEGSIEYVNPRFSELMGYEADEILGMNPKIIKTEYTPPDFHEDLWNKISEGRTWIGEFVNRKKDESTLYQSAVISPLIDSSGNKTGYVAFEDDISLQKEIAQEIRTMDQELKDKSEEINQLKDQIKEQSIHDSLTGLYNRAYLNEILPREILRSTRARNNLVMMVIDIDHFKSINQKFGYDNGDMVLKKVSEIISSSMSSFDLVFRYGNDEFVVLFSGKTGDLGESRSEQIKEAIEKLIIQSDFGEIKLTGSIGIAVYPSHGKKAAEMITHAEDALAKSKQLGGNQVTL